MYPIIRVVKEILIARRMPSLAPLDSYVSHHRCWPQDIDTYMEMNNGRILTILDIGRTGLAQRIGLLAALSKNRWGLTVAGNSIMYRKRIRPFAKFRVVSKCVGWDARFVYVEQSIWIGPDCAVQALLRTAVTDKNGIVKPALLMAAMDLRDPSPALPDWVQNWIDADKTRPWPPTDNGGI